MYSNLIMMSRFSYGFIFALLTIASFSGCIKEETFPETPIISVKELTLVSSDSARLVISFTDGDGDIGLAQSDTFAPFNPSSRYNTNLWVVYLYDDGSGNFVPYDNDQTTVNYVDSLVFNARVPVLTQNGQKESLSGDIQYVINPAYAIPGHSRFRYKVRLIDRKLNMSDWVETPVVNQ